MRASNIGKHAQDEQDMNASMVSFDGNEACGARRLPLERSLRHLSHHAVIDDG